LSTTGTYSATCSEAVFLLEEALLVVGCSTSTCLDTYLVGAIPLVAASSVEETMSSTWWVYYSEGSVCLGVFWVFWEDFLDDLVEGLMANFEDGGGDIYVG